MAYADVAVNAAAPLRQTFTYSVPDGLDVRAGHAVYVPFGTRTLQGVVMAITEESAFAEVRDLKELIDPRPLLSPAHIALARSLGDYYLAPLFDCVSLMLPAGFKRRPLTILHPLATRDELPDLRLTERQQAVLAYVIDRGEVESEELRRSVKTLGVANAISALLRRGFLHRSYRLSRPPISPTVVPHLRLL